MSENYAPIVLIIAVLLFMLCAIVKGSGPDRARYTKPRIQQDPTFCPGGCSTAYDFSVREDGSPTGHGGNSGGAHAQAHVDDNDRSHDTWWNDHGMGIQADSWPVKADHNQEVGR